MGPQNPQNPQNGVPGVVEGWFDGLCDLAGGRRNPGGLACGGWVVAPGPHGGLIEGSACYCVGEGSTNNVAEYRAALDCLRAIWRAGWRGRVLLHGDSQLVVRQYEGSYGCYAPILVPLLAQLRAAASHFAAVDLAWVPRERNERADALSRAAYARHRALPGYGLAVPPPWDAAESERLVGLLVAWGAAHPLRWEREGVGDRMDSICEARDMAALRTLHARATREREASA